jgi:hypothetical protein
MIIRLYKTLPLAGTLEPQLFHSRFERRGLKPEDFCRPTGTSDAPTLEAYGCPVCRKQPRFSFILSSSACVSPDLADRTCEQQGANNQQ